MKTTRRHYIILLLLVFVFAAPGLSAYFLYFHPQWLSAPATNKGELLKPPIRLSDLNQHAKWQLILWNPGACEKPCIDQLDKLSRIHLALGRRLYDVDLCLLLPNATVVPAELQTILDKQRVCVVHLSLEDTSRIQATYPLSELFIANPDSYLVLAYPEQAPPDDVFHDIKLLLKR